MSHKFIDITLFLVMLVISNNVFSQADHEGSASHKNITPTENIDMKMTPLRAVEVGSGGNIKLERKYRTKIESQYEWHAHLLWESRYVTEGRDNLPDNNLLSASTEFNYNELTIVPWFANSIGSDYTEFNLNIVYGTRLTKTIMLFTGYNFIHSSANGIDSNDNEISIDVAYKWLKNLNASASVYHSFEAGGSFMEFAVKYNNAISKHLRYSLQAVVGANMGYVTDGHDGLNHLQLRANVSHHPIEQIEVYVYTGYNLAINRDEIRYVDDGLLRDFVWGGIGVSYLF